MRTTIRFTDRAPPHVTTFFDHPAALSAGIAHLMAMEADRWSRVRFMARVVTLAGADLDDEGDVIRALMAARYCVADFEDMIEDVIEQAREIGRIEQ